MGDVRLRQFTKSMIQGDFCDAEGAEPWSVQSKIQSGITR